MQMTSKNRWTNDIANPSVDGASPTVCDEMPITAILNMARRFLQLAIIRPAAHVIDQK